MSERKFIITVWLPDFLRWLESQTNGSVTERRSDAITAEFEYGDVKVTLRNIPITPGQSDTMTWASFPLRFETNAFATDWAFIPAAQRLKMDLLETSGELGADAGAIAELWEERMFGLFGWDERGAERL